MRSIEEYLDQAPRFHALAALTTEPTLKKRYADPADCYRLLAADREKLIQNGTIAPNDNEP